MTTAGTPLVGNAFTVYSQGRLNLFQDGTGAATSRLYTGAGSTTNRFEVTFELAYTEIVGAASTFPTNQAFFDFDWHSGLACVQHGQRFGYVDRQGREVIACQFEDAFDFIGEHALITEGGRYGLINRQGRVTVPCQFDGGEALDYTGAYWSVQQGELWGVIDPTGRWMLPPRKACRRVSSACCPSTARCRKTSR